jgi:predicted anti-sigma-YlaC factor YlaD
MNCEEARSMTSAAVDAELPAAEIAALGLHTEGCEACRDWQQRAQWLARVTRLDAADAVPGPDQAWKHGIVATAPRRRTRGQRLRVALVAVALVELAVTLPLFLFGRVDAIRDQGALDVALAAGLLVVAWRPWRAAGLQTVLGAAALLLVSTEVIDLIRGEGEVLDLGRHLLVLASWWIVWSLARAVPQTPPASHAAERRPWRRSSWPAEDAPPSPPAPDGRTQQPAAQAVGERSERRAA